VVVEVEAEELGVTLAGDEEEELDGVCAEGEREDAIPKRMPFGLPIASIRTCQATWPALNGIAC
jgi:hypothetical protein